jgi:predicted nucleotidyltransferase
MRDRILDIARELCADRFKGAAVAFAAGSIVRGDGTAFSDLDLVVVFERLDRAWRESFLFDGVPVEAFAHDPSTLEYFFLEVDRPSGVPSLPNMVHEGVEIPGPTPLSTALKRRAAAILDAGPPALDEAAERGMRYLVSDLLDDLRAPRSRDELIGAGVRLYEPLAAYLLRRRGRWSAHGKAIPRALRRFDPDLGDAFCDAFTALFAHADSGPVVRLTDDLLREAGGPLFDGYRLDAPAEWRRPVDAPSER